MKFSIGIDNREDANKFLRRLWAEFRNEFGKCVWHYTPYRMGENNTIIFGMMDIGIPEGALQVDVFYIRKGTIQTINFDFVQCKLSLDRYQELNQKIEKIIKNSKSNFNQTLKFFYRVGIYNIFLPLGYYKGNNFYIDSSQENKFNLGIATLGYDEIDAQTKCKSKILQCLDLLSVETNSPFWSDEPVDEIQQDVEKEVFMENLEWIDDYPVIEDKLRLSKSGKKFLDLIAGDGLNKEQKLFLRACNHFHTARKYDAQVNNLLKHTLTEEIDSGHYEITLEERDERLTMAAKMGATHMEIASVLYLSALEVVSSIGIEESKNCPQCNQKVYSIGSRVVNMVEKYHSSHLGKEFRGYYSKRSKYLHAGELLSNYSYTGTTIPQLDPSDPTGCEVHSGIPLPNLREYTSFCLRKVLQSLV